MAGTYPGWWVVASSIAIQTLHIAIFAQGYGVYVPALQAEFNWSATLLAAGFALVNAVTGVLSPVQGLLLTRFGPRNILRLGLIVLAVSFIAFSQITTVTQFFAVFTLLAVGHSLGGFLTLTTAVVNWFEERRSFALSLMQLGVTLGGFALPLVAWSLAEFGWRPTAFASGVVILLLGLPLAQLVRNNPEELGLLPDGAEPAGAPAGHGGDDSDGDKVTPLGAREFLTREALKTRAFWYLAFGHALALAVVAAVNVHAVIHLNQGLGYTLPAAAGFMALMTGCTVAGQLVGGYFGDRYPKRLLAMGAMWAHALGLLALAYATLPLLVVLFAVGHGFAWGLRGPLMQAIRADYFGRRRFATIMGYSLLIAMVGTIAGPLVAGYLADLFGDFRFGFTVLAASAAFGSVLFLLARPPEPRGSLPRRRRRVA